MKGKKVKILLPFIFFKIFIYFKKFQRFFFLKLVTIIKNFKIFINEYFKKSFLFFLTFFYIYKIKWN